MIYGSCRVSTKTQNIERQERNIKTLYLDAAKEIIRKHSKTFGGSLSDK